ncbi:hypothetical protein BDY24DRAFT_370064 [Mrakia frigida]|uniref:clathrin-mediated endocytosis regulator UBX3 n=1 Tax=Mrakia frigida TaxID=29902 RepID=UPI003FCC1CEA
MSSPSLSSSQQDSFDQLLSITSSTSEQERERDLRILRETGWNVQAAVEVIFSSPAPAASSSSTQPAPISSSSSSRSSGLPYSSFSIDDSQQSSSGPLLPLPPNLPPPSSPGGLGSRRTAGFRIPRGLRGITRVGMGLGWTLYSIILWPVGVLWGLLGGGWGWLVRALPPSIRNLLPRSFLPTTLPPSSSSARPKGSATLIFLRSLEALTNARSPSSIGERSLASQQGVLSSSTTALLAEDDEEEDGEDGEERLVLPEFFIGKYKDALELAKKDARVLLVGLFSGVHQGDEVFKKTVLTDPLLVKALKRHKVLFWAGDVRDREPYQVSRLLPPTTYPSLSFISLLPSSSPSSSRTTTPTTSTLKLTILSRLEGPTTTALSLTTALEQSVLPRVASILARVQREKRLREEERRLREDQDRAFRESEGRDLERIMKVRGEREREERERRERVEREKEEGRKRERRIEYLRFARAKLIPEETLTTDSATTVITLRLPPHPKPYKRRFPSTTPVEVLYLWADTLTLPEDLPRAGDPEDPPTDVGGGYKHEFGFRLATSYPRKVVELEEGNGDGTVGGSEVLRVGAGVVVLERIMEGSGEGKDGEGSDEEEEEEEEEGSGSGGVEVSD